MNRVDSKNRYFPCVLFLLLLFFAFPAKGENGVGVKVMDFKQLKPLLGQNNDSIYVVNFWATWCAPCIKEVPHFEQFGEKYRDKKVRVLMVSLDMSDQLETKLIPFIEKENMRNEVILLDDPHFNDWIPLVDENWTGTIPATLVFGKGFREFFPFELTLNDLEEIVKPLLVE